MRNRTLIPQTDTLAYSQESRLYVRILSFFIATVVVLGASLGVGFFAIVNYGNAQNEDPNQLRELIFDRNKRLIELRDEIERYQRELAGVTAERQTLESTIRTLDLSRNKLESEIALTSEQINRTDLELRQLDMAIRETELLIERDGEIIANSLRRIDELDNKTLLEALLTHNSLAEFWDEMSETMAFQEAIYANLKLIQERKERLETSISESERVRMRLTELQQELNGERSALSANRQEKSRVLTATSNQEEEYQRQLRERIAARDQFLTELRDLESKLQFVLNPSTIPRAGSGVLTWPFDPTYMANCPSFVSALGNPHCITQYFGNTAFAQSGAYRGQGHNGVDFRAAPGTRITAALAGTVVEVNSTVAHMCQYGKWVLIRHNNGLTTLYAHLSSIAVSKGQTVATGELIGHSGATGYATGPHLHLSVYASEAVQFKQYTCRSNGVTLTIPVSAWSGYLNPLDYL